MDPFTISYTSGDRLVVEPSGDAVFAVTGLRPGGRGSSGPAATYGPYDIMAAVPYSDADAFRDWLVALTKDAPHVELTSTIIHWTDGDLQSAQATIEAAAVKVKAARLAERTLAELRRVYGNEIWEGDEGERAVEPHGDVR